MRMIRLLTTVTLLIMGAQCLASAHNETVKTLKSRFPELPIDSIGPSPVNGILEVKSGPMVLYLSNDGRYAIQGDIIDLKDGDKNLTELARREARKAVVASGADKMIRYEASAPKHVVTIYTDIDCGYCRQLHRQLNEYLDEGISIQYAPFPRQGPGSDSFTKAESVWCQATPDAQRAALDDAKAGKSVNRPDACDATATINELFEQGILMRVQGTPTMILPNGEMVSGYVKAEELAKYLKTAN